MQQQKVRVGIDVGGTHTKAVAIDNATHAILGKSSVKTTHDHELGVAAGVVQAFELCLKDNHINPEDVIFIAHSTTQATNALLEGDVAKVGIIGYSNGWLEGLLCKRQTNIDDIPLGTGKFIHTSHVHKRIAGLDKDEINRLIDHTEIREKMRQHDREVAKENAADLIAREIIDIALEHEG